MRKIKNIFCDILGIETKEEKIKRQEKDKKDQGDYSTMSPQQPTTDDLKEKKELQWADVNEPLKFVCLGGTIKCPYHLADGILKPTSTEVLLQDKPHVTSGDTNGKINFMFAGNCMHPKWGSFKPLCIAVIHLGKWQNVANSYVDNYNPVLVQSTISCMISGQKLKVTSSGQKSDIKDVDVNPNIPDQVIKSVEILKGNEVESGTIIQYVNIVRDNKYVDGTDITHIDRLGQKLKFKVKFDKPGASRFKVKLKPEATNVVYDADEKLRNSNFKYSEGEIEFTTDANGEKIVDSNDIFVSPAGGDIFTISASDVHGTEIISAAKVQTQRIMYYLEAKMAGLTTMASSLGIFTNEYEKHNITFKTLPSVSIPHMHNIGNDSDSNIFLNNIQAAYASSGGPAKSPYCIIIGYTDHLAVKDANQVITPVNALGGTTTPINVPIIKPGSTQKKALWVGLVPSEDWFVDCYFLKDGGTSSDKILIEQSKCTIIQSTIYPTGYYDSVNVDISALDSLNGKIVLKVNSVNRMRGGLSFEGTNIVAICTKAWWQAETEASQCQVIIHEIGHQLGMVSDGSGKLPTKNPYFYDTSQGHVGSHCHYDIVAGQARYDSVTDHTNSKCVMYGATNGKSAFCVECTKALKKVDLSSGV